MSDPMPFLAMRPMPAGRSSYLYGNAAGLSRLRDELNRVLKDSAAFADLFVLTCAAPGSMKHVQVVLSDKERHPDDPADSAALIETLIREIRALRAELEKTTCPGSGIPSRM